MLCVGETHSHADKSVSPLRSPGATDLDTPKQRSLNQYATWIPLYDQKPEEPVVPVVSATSNTPSVGLSFTSRFEYVENVQSTEMSSGGPQVLSHVAAPKPSSFFADYGMDNGFQKKSSSKVQ
ncbi:hypothetical protein ACOSQ3_000440 [Xanthoceras sorbifolium]